MLLVTLWGCTLRWPQSGNCTVEETSIVSWDVVVTEQQSKGKPSQAFLLLFCQAFKRVYNLILWELTCTVKKCSKFCEVQHFSDLSKHGILLQTSSVHRNWNSSLYSR